MNGWESKAGYHFLELVPRQLESINKHLEEISKSLKVIAEKQSEKQDGENG